MLITFVYIFVYFGCWETCLILHTEDISFLSRMLSMAASMEFYQVSTLLYDKLNIELLTRTNVFCFSWWNIVAWAIHIGYIAYGMIRAKQWEECEATCYGSKVNVNKRGATCAPEMCSRNKHAIFMGITYIIYCQKKELLFQENIH